MSECLTDSLLLGGIGAEERQQRSHQLRPEAPELFAVSQRELAEHSLPLSREADVRNSPVVICAQPLEEPLRLEAVDQLDRAVMFQSQSLGELSDGRSRSTKATHREQQLMLRGIQPGRARVLLGEDQEEAKLMPKLREQTVVAIREGTGHDVDIS